MTTGPGIERRLARLENEDMAIYDLITEHRAESTVFRAEFDSFRAEALTRFDGIDATLAEVLRRLPESA